MREYHCFIKTEKVKLEKIKKEKFYFLTNFKLKRSNLILVLLSMFVVCRILFNEIEASVDPVTNNHVVYFAIAQKL